MLFPVPDFLNTFKSNDPVIFNLSASKKNVRIGEEVEIVVTAQWSFITPSMLFTFEGSNEFTLKVLKPDGFVITEGTETIVGKVDRNNPYQRYTIKGYFENIEDVPIFTLLRGHGKASDLDYFIKKGEIVFHKNYSENTEISGLNSVQASTSGLSDLVIESIILKNPRNDGAYCSADEILSFDLTIKNTSATTVESLVYLHLPMAGCFTTENQLISSLYYNADGFKSEAFGNNQTKTITLSYKVADLILGLASNSINNRIWKNYHADFVKGNEYDCVNGNVNVGIYFEIPPTPTIRTDKYTNGATLTAENCQTYQVKWSNGQIGNTILNAADGVYTATCFSTGTYNCEGVQSNAITIRTNCNGLPAAPTVSSQKSVIAHGEVLELIATNCSGEVNWLGPNTLQLSGPTINVTQAGNYKASCTTICGTSTFSPELTILLLPLNIVSNKTEVYHNETFTLTAYNCNGYVIWKDAQGNITSIQNDKTTTFTGSGVYQAKCVSYIDIHSDWVIIEIQPRTIPIHVAFADKTYANPNETVTLTSVGCEPYFYNWEVGGQSKFGNIQTVVGPGTYKVRCMYSDDKPYGNYISVTVLPKPINTPNVSANKTSAYEIEEVILTATGCDPYFNNWEINGESKFGVTQTVTGPGTYKVRCILSDNTPYGAFVSITIAPKAINKPIPTTDRTQAYEAEIVNLNASGCEPYYYQWSINGQSKFGAAQTATGPGDYSVRCFYSDYSTASEFVTVKVHPKALNTPTPFASQTNASPTETISLSATGCESSGYRWTINQNGNVTLVFSPTTTVVGAGTFYVNCVSGNQVGPQAQITVSPKPPGAIAIESSKTNACSEEPVAFKGTGCENGKIVWKKDLSVALSDLNPFHTEGSWRKDKSHDNKPLTIGGKSFDRGIGAHAYSKLKFDLGGNYQAFKATIGRDDESDGCCGSEFSVTFKVVVDGEEKLNKLMTNQDNGFEIDVAVQGKSTLELIVEPMAQNWGDHADWADARLVPNGGAEEIQSGQQVDFFGSGRYEAYCVTAGISGPMSSINVLPCNTNAPKIITSKTRVFPFESFTLDATGDRYYVKSTQNNTNTLFWGHQVPASITGATKLEAPWGGGSTVKAEVFTQESDGLLLLANKYKARDGEQVYIMAFGCDYGRVEWKIGNLAPSYGHVKVVTGPGFYRARCVPDANGNPELYTNSDWTLLTISPNGIVQPIVTAPLSMCPGTATSLSATGCPSGYQYQWKTLENGWANFSPTISISSPQEIEARCLKNDYSFWYPSTKVTIYPTFPADFKVSNNGPVLVGSNLRMAATYLPNATYRWTGPNGYDSGTPSAAKRAVTINGIAQAGTGTYTLTATANGCTTTATTDVKIKECSFKIKAIDPITGGERYTLYPDPQNSGQFKPLALITEAPEGLPLNNYDFEWSTTSGATIANIHDPNIAVATGGVYKVRVSPFDNPNVGCVASVGVEEFNPVSLNWSKASIETLADGSEMVSMDIKNFGLPFLTYSKNEEIEIDNFQPHLFNSRVLYFKLTDGTLKSYIIKTAPSVNYRNNNQVSQASNFEGAIYLVDYQTGKYVYGWNMSNGQVLSEIPYYAFWLGEGSQDENGECSQNVTYTTERFVITKYHQHNNNQNGTFGTMSGYVITETHEGTVAVNCCLILGICNNEDFENPIVDPGETATGGSSVPARTSLADAMNYGLSELMQEVSKKLIIVKNSNGQVDNCKSGVRAKLYMQLMEDALKSHFSEDNGYQAGISGNINFNFDNPVGSDPKKPIEGFVRFLNGDDSPTKNWISMHDVAKRFTQSFGNGPIPQDPQTTTDPPAVAVYNAMQVIKPKLKSAFAALLPFLADCDCEPPVSAQARIRAVQAADCDDALSMIEVIRNAFTANGLDIGSELQFFDNQAYAEESTLAMLATALGTNNNGTTITYTPPTPETSASLSFKNGESVVEVKSEEQVRKGFAQELSRGIDYSISLNEDTWETTVFDDPLWELIFEAITETVPDFIPVYGEYLELKRAVEAFDNGSYGQSSFHFSMAILGVIGIDKIKDIAKITKSMQRAYKMWKLIKKIEILSPALARGMLGMVKNKNKVGHIFRVADGHMPALQPLVEWVGGQENLLYLVNKTIYDNGLINNLPINLEQVRRIVINGTEVETKFIKYVKDGVEYIQVSNFYIP